MTKRVIVNNIPYKVIDENDTWVLLEGTGYNIKKLKSELKEFNTPVIDDEPEVSPEPVQYDEPVEPDNNIQPEVSQEPIQPEPTNPIQSDSSQPINNNIEELSNDIMEKISSDEQFMQSYQDKIATSGQLSADQFVTDYVKLTLAELLGDQEFNKLQPSQVDEIVQQVKGMVQPLEITEEGESAPTGCGITGPGTTTDSVAQFKSRLGQNLRREIKEKFETINIKEMYPYSDAGVDQTIDPNSTDDETQFRRNENKSRRSLAIENFLAKIRGVLQEMEDGLSQEEEHDDELLEDDEIITQTTNPNVDLSDNGNI